MSRLVGTGSIEGELYLNHMPVSQSKRFQIGLGANNHNCDFGFGGWFGWHGVLNGTPVAGLTGDIVANATLPEFEAPGCNDEHVELVYATVDPVVGSSQQVVQRWERLDTTAPVFLGAPQDVTLEWSDMVGADCNTWFIEVPCVEIDDNCSGWNPAYPWVRRNLHRKPCGEVLFFSKSTRATAPPNSKSCGPGLPSTQRATLPSTRKSSRCKTQKARPSTTCPWT